MELSERYIQKLEEEGFVHVYDHQDVPGTVYEAHAHKGKVSLIVTDGLIVFDFEGEKKALTVGDRLDVPVSAPHSAAVGPEGCGMVVGEMIEGDS